jgi:hypothetical protein
MHVSLLPHPVPGVAPPHALPLAPHVTAGRSGIGMLAAQELPETVPGPTAADTLHGAVPAVQLVPPWAPHVEPP